MFASLYHMRALGILHEPTEVLGHTKARLLYLGGNA